MTKHYEELLVEGLTTDSALDAHQAIRMKLDEMLNRKLNMIKESDDQRNAALEIKMAAMTYGGGNVDDHNGVIIVYFDNKRAATDYADWLETQETVETYEINTMPQVGTGDHPNAIEMELMTDPLQCNFQIIAYLYPEYTSFDYDFDGDGDEDESDVALAGGTDGALVDIDEPHDIDESVEVLDEVTRKIRVNSRGVKSIKMKCTQGFRWDPTLQACIKISGQELAIMRKGSRRALITKNAMGNSFKVRVKRRIRKAFKIRKMMGLEI